METLKFHDLFCATFKCASDEFESTVLWRCLFPKSLPVARMLWRVNPGYFVPDMELIRRIGESTSLDEVKSELIDFYNCHPHHGWLRKRLKVRLSGQSITNMAGKLFGETDAGPVLVCGHPAVQI